MARCKTYADRVNIIIKMVKVEDYGRSPLSSNARGK